MRTDCRAAVVAFVEAFLYSDLLIESGASYLLRSSGFNKIVRKKLFLVCVQSEFTTGIAVRMSAGFTA